MTKHFYNNNLAEFILISMNAQYINCDVYGLMSNGEVI